MEYGFVSSPSASPNTSTFSHGHYFDNTSESSSPNSPRHTQHPMMFRSAVPYDMYAYTTTATNFHPSQPANKIPVEFTGSTSLDDKDRRRRRSGTSAKSNDTDGTSIPNTHLRRRAQNRASQRAFRERKEKHVKGLEHQLEDLHERHQDLLQSYTRQAEEVTKLNSRIAELAAEISAMRTQRDAPFHEPSLPDRFDKFDAFSSTGAFYGGPDCYYDRNAVSFPSGFALQSFEDSL